MVFYEYHNVDLTFKVIMNLKRICLLLFFLTYVFSQHSSLKIVQNPNNTNNLGKVDLVIRDSITFQSVKLFYSNEKDSNWKNVDFDIKTLNSDFIDGKKAIYYRLEFTYLEDVHPFVLQTSLFYGDVYLNNSLLLPYDKEIDINLTPISRYYPLHKLKSGRNAIFIESKLIKGQVRIGRNASFLFLKQLKNLEMEKSHLMWELFYAGLFLMSFLVSIVLYLNGNKGRDLLYFTIFCFTYFIGAISNRVLDWFGFYALGNDLEGIIIYDIFQTIYILMYAKFLSVHVNYTFKKNLLYFPIIFIAAHFFVFPTDFIILAAPNMFKAAMIVPFLMITFSSNLKKYRIIQLGVICFIASYVMEFTMYNSIYSQITSLVMLLTMVISVVKDMDEKRVLLEEKKLESARLEIQLLKKNIQPHYLMNSLESIIGWLEEEPENSIEIIELLAKEFRMILDIADKKKITLSKELELCENHIKIMSLRKDIRYKIETKNIDEVVEIPPLILHTLIENGVSHSVGSEHCIFEVEYVKRSDGFSIRVFNKHQLKTREENSGSGLGTKYIKARLEESYEGRWNFVSQPIHKGWETVITVIG